MFTDQGHIIFKGLHPSDCSVPCSGPAGSLKALPDGRPSLRELCLRSFSLFYFVMAGGFYPPIFKSTRRFGGRLANTLARARSRVSGNDRLFPRGSEFGPNLEIPAGPVIQLRPRPGNQDETTGLWARVRNRVGWKIGVTWSRNRGPFWSRPNWILGPAMNLGPASILGLYMAPKTRLQDGHNKSYISGI